MNTSREINTLLKAAHEEGLDVMGIVLSNRVQRELEEEAEEHGAVQRVRVVGEADAAQALSTRRVVGYLHPVTGEMVPIHVADLPSRVIGLTIPEP